MSLDRHRDESATSPGHKGTQRLADDSSLTFPSVCHNSFIHRRSCSSYREPRACWAPSSLSPRRPFSVPFREMWSEKCIDCSRCVTVRGSNVESPESYSFLNRVCWIFCVWEFCAAVQRPILKYLLTLHQHTDALDYVSSLTSYRFS